MGGRRVPPLSTALTLAVAALLILAGCSGTTTGTSAMPGDTTASASPGASQDFYFQDLGERTERQGGTTLDIFVGLRYNADALARQDYPDYRVLARRLAGLLAPSAELPENVTWERLSQAMVEDLMATAPLSGATVAVRVHPTCTRKPGDSASRPNWRAAVFTAGDIPALTYPEMSTELC